MCCCLSQAGTAGCVRDRDLGLGGLAGCHCFTNERKANSETQATMQDGQGTTRPQATPRRLWVAHGVRLLPSPRPLSVCYRLRTNHHKLLAEA